MSPYRKPDPPAAERLPIIVPLWMWTLLLIVVAVSGGMAYEFFVGGPRATAEAQSPRFQIDYSAGSHNEADVWSAAYAGCLAGDRCLANYSPAEVADRAVRAWRERQP